MLLAYLEDEMELETIPGVFDLIRKRVYERKTYLFISEELKARFPRRSGLSVRSIRRYCKKHDIQARPTPLCEEHLDRVISSSIAKVCHDYLKSGSRG